MNLVIKKINIQKFRGFVDSEIILNGKNLIIKGDNGTGKSTIVDALEYFFTNNIKHLTKGEKLSVRKYASHIKYSPEELKIDIEFKNGEISTKTISTKPQIPPGMEKFFNAAKIQKFILNRSELLEFINSTPGKRFKIIAKLIGLEDLEKQSKEFSKLSNEISNHLNSIENSFNHILKRISKLLEINITNTSDIINALNYKLSLLSYPELKSLENIEEYKKERFIKDLNNIIELSSSTKFDPKIYDLIKKINVSSIEIEQIQEFIDMELIKFLENGLNLLESRKPIHCPLCDQPIKVNELINNIKNTLVREKKLSENLEKFNQLKSDFKNLIEFLLKNLIKLLDNVKRVNELKNLNRKLISLKINLEEIIKNISKDKTDYKSIEINLKKIEKELDEFLVKLNLECKERKNGIEFTEEDKESYQILDLLNKIQIEYENLKSKEIELIRARRKNEIVKSINNIFSEVLKEEINKIFDSLASEINRLYLYLHPKDLHRNIRLEIDPNKRGSLVLKIDSFDRESQDPRALASEGHLDSLGICIFLSFVKKFNKSIPIIVLDDIITTIDANHRERLAKLLLTEFPEYQLIITTHDGLWFKQLIENLRALKLEHKWEILTIIDWNLSYGPE
ncbi:MAG: AAA family ATPase, partial [Promethearchaeota archaeon]